MPDFLQTTMTNMILSIIGFVGAILFVIIGYFVKQFMKDITAEMRRLTAAINSISGSIIGVTKDIDSINEKIEVLKENSKRIESVSEREHKNIEGKLIQIVKDVTRLKLEQL